MSLLIVSETHLLHLTTQVYHPIWGMSNKKIQLFRKFFIFSTFYNILLLFAQMTAHKALNFCHCFL